MKQWRLTFPGAAALAALVFLGGGRRAPQDPPIPALSEKEFASPPLEARPGVLWPWLNGYVDTNQITKELEELKAKGLRGAIIWDVGSLADPDKIIPAGPAFLGKESIDAIGHAIDEASRLGLELGLAGASSWNAGVAQRGAMMRATAPNACCTPIVWPRARGSAALEDSAVTDGNRSAVPIGTRGMTSACSQMVGGSV